MELQLVNQLPAQQWSQLFMQKKMGQKSASLESVLFNFLVKVWSQPLSSMRRCFLMCLKC